MFEVKDQLLKLKKVSPDVKDAEYYFKIANISYDKKEYEEAL